MATATTDEIRTLRCRTELLAPAGRPDVIEAVLDAGADAVYLSGKSFQMRAHRGDFHFDDAALRDAVALIHQRGRRVYVTVNTLLAAHELDEARGFLERLEELEVDAAIVCDLASLALARERGVGFELHASTMMNVHDVDQAIALKELGVSRIITSRDISIQEAGQLGERSGVPVEYFLHGDMCVAQSGQCNLSGIALGKSANRGECMKPCRWEYELISAEKEQCSEPVKRGRLMAIRDLALIRQIPDLVEAGICSLKIEGRMRDAAYLGPLVRVYREGIDRCYETPGEFFVPAEALDTLFRHRVRDLSTVIATGAPSNATLFDVSGRREPLMLSNGVRERSVTADDFEEPAFEVSSRAPAGRRVELAVCVGDVSGTRNALEAGADRIYLAAETRQLGSEAWAAESLRDAMALVAEAGAALGIRTPRVSGTRGRAEWSRLLRVCRDEPVRYVLTHHLGALRRARRDLPEAEIVADYGFNVLNPLSVEVLRDLGAGAVVLSQEAGFEDVLSIAEDAALPVELVVHGPITAMLLEHCLIALHLTRSGAKDVCRAPCQHAEFALRDAAGEERTIVTDQYCRNHVLAAKDLAILPSIDKFLRLPVAVFRIEAQFYSPELTGRLTAAYREALDAIEAGEEASPAPESWATLLEASPRPWNYGAYAQSVTRSASTAAVMRALA
jgi:putative protease